MHLRWGWDRKQTGEMNESREHIKVGAISKLIKFLGGMVTAE